MALLAHCIAMLAQLSEEVSEYELVKKRLVPLLIRFIGILPRPKALPIHAKPLAHQALPLSD
jgi:hypothetical protein